MAAISSRDWSSTSLRITTLRCTVGSSANRDTAVSTASRRISTSTGSGLSGSATSWAASMGSAARIARLRNRSSARLWAIRNSQARSGGSSSSSSSGDEGPGEGVLHHILAVDHRAHQPRAVAVKLRPQLAGERQELRPGAPWAARMGLRSSRLSLEDRDPGIALQAEGEARRHTAGRPAPRQLSRRTRGAASARRTGPGTPRARCPSPRA